MATTQSLTSQNERIQGKLEWMFRDVGTHSDLATSEVIAEPCLYSDVFITENHFAKTQQASVDL